MANNATPHPELFLSRTPSIFCGSAHSFHSAWVMGVACRLRLLGRQFRYGKGSPAAVRFQGSWMILQATPTGRGRQRPDVRDMRACLQADCPQLPCCHRRVRRDKSAKRVGWRDRLRFQCAVQRGGAAGAGGSAKRRPTPPTRWRWGDAPFGLAPCWRRGPTILAKDRIMQYPPQVTNLGAKPCTEPCSSC